MFLSAIQGENPAAQNSQLSDLSNAWSSNLLDCLTTLALVQSNNGEPNWGPNHATKHTVELLNQIGSSPSYITLIMVWNPGWLQKCPVWNPISLSCSCLCSSGQVCMPMCKNLLILPAHERFLPLMLCRISVVWVGGEKIVVPVVAMLLFCNSFAKETCYFWVLVNMSQYAKKKKKEKVCLYVQNISSSLCFWKPANN